MKIRRNAVAFLRILLFIGAIIRGDHSGLAGLTAPFKVIRSGAKLQFYDSAVKMYHRFNELPDSLDVSDSEIIDLKTQDINVVLGALFLFVVRVDGRTRPEETTLYNDLVENFLNISEDERNAFEENVARQLSNVKNLEDLIELLRSLPQTKKQQVHDYLNEIAICDSEFHEVEFNVCERVGEILGLI